MDKKEYKRQWRAKNKVRLQLYRKQYVENHDFKLKRKIYYEANKAAIALQRKRRYKENMQVREMFKTRSKKRYAEKSEECMTKNRQRAKIKKAKMDRIQLYYGCQNPGCKWGGEFLPVQLHFHHKDRTTKIYNVSAMTGLGEAKIAEEINKCCVLCANCHNGVTAGLIAISDNISCKVNESLIW